MNDSTKRILKIVLLLLVTLLIVLTLAVNYISTAGLEFGREIGLFPKYNSSLPWSRRTAFQNITISPDNWTFSVWGLIYAYQGVMLAYLWSTVFRSVNGSYLCCDPDLAPYGLLICHILSSIFNIVWVILAERSDMELPILIPMTLMLFFITFCLYGTLVFSYWSLYKAKDDLIRAEKTVEYWLVVGLVQNSLSIYAGWCTIASFINLDMLFVFYARLNETACSIGCISTVIAIVVVYAVCDLTVLDMITRFVFTPHLIVIWAGAGVLSRHYNPGAATSILVILLMCLAGVALIVKIVLIVIRSKSKPILDNRLKSSFQSEIPLDQDRPTSGKF